MLLKKLLNTKSSYIVFFICVLFLNLFINSELWANSLKISNLEVSEPFDLKFNKKKVFNKAFLKAFFQLSVMITHSNDKEKIKQTSIQEVKSLIDSFVISDEKFINNKYFATFNVYFNKRNTFDFLARKNIFPSIPKKIDLLLIPILIEVDQNRLALFNENLIYQKWNKKKNNYSLVKYILPTEDLEDIKTLNLNYHTIEEYNFNKILKKHDLNNYIILIIYKNKTNLKVLSKIQMNNDLKIVNSSFKNIDFSNEDDVEKFITKLKIFYEDNWKNLNRINTSVKLPITIYLQSNNYKKIKSFEKIMKKLDLVSSFQIISFDSEYIFYKVIYNGSPKNFILDTKNNGINIVKNNQFWEVK